MPSLGSLVHYGVDFILIAMLLSGVKHVTGMEFDPASLAHSNDSIWLLSKVLSGGDYLFRRLCQSCVESKMFKKVSWKEAYSGWVGKLASSAGFKPEDFMSRDPTSLGD